VPEQSELGEPAKKVLEAVRARSMDGYSLLSRTGLRFSELPTAVEELLGKGLVMVTGDLNPDTIGDSVFSIPVDAVGNADVALGKLRPTTSYR
jgi:hypothetical protein